MRNPQKIALAATVALGLAGAAAIPAFSANDPQAGNAQGEHGKDWHHGHHGMGWMSPRFVDARIAFLKTALKITDAQEQAFDGVAKVMREDAAERMKMHESFRAEMPKNALERMELHAKIAEMHAQHLAAFVAAFKPLYDGLSDDQRKAADELLGSHLHHRG